MARSHAQAHNRLAEELGGERMCELLDAAHAGMCAAVNALEGAALVRMRNAARAWVDAAVVLHRTAKTLPLFRAASTRDPWSMARDSARYAKGVPARILNLADELPQELQRARDALATLEQLLAAADRGGRPHGAKGDPALAMAAGLADGVAHLLWVTGTHLVLVEDIWELPTRTGDDDSRRQRWDAQLRRARRRRDGSRKQRKIRRSK